MAIHIKGTPQVIGFTSFVFPEKHSTLYYLCVFWFTYFAIRMDLIGVERKKRWWNKLAVFARKKNYREPSVSENFLFSHCLLESNWNQKKYINQKHAWMQLTFLASFFVRIHAERSDLAQAHLETLSWIWTIFILYKIMLTNMGYFMVVPIFLTKVTE